MNEGNKLLCGEELRSVVMGDHVDLQRWSESVQRQLVVDGPLHWNFARGERIMSDGSVLGLPRIPKPGSKEDERRREDQAERHTDYWKGRGKGLLRDQEKGKGGAYGKVKGGAHARSQEEEDRYDTCGDEVTEDRIVDRNRLGLCRRCGLSGHDKYMSPHRCKAHAGVICMECGFKGHMHRACHELGFSWEKRHLANPLRVRKCEDDNFH